MKQGKLSTPAWILEGYDSPAAYAKARQKAEPLATSSTSSQSKGIKKEKKSEKNFKIRVCPKCKSDNVCVVLTGEEGKGAKSWECKKCKWVGTDIDEKELTEEEFMKYLDDKGEEIQ
jgi:hypothetical protein